MLAYVVGVIYAIPIYKIVEQVLMFATVRSYILTVRGHSLVRVRFDTVLYGVQFFCRVFDVSIKYLMQWRWKKLWETLKIQNQEKAVRKKRLLSATTALSFSTTLYPSFSCKKIVALYRKSFLKRSLFTNFSLLLKVSQVCNILNKYLLTSLLAG